MCNIRNVQRHTPAHDFWAEIPAHMSHWLCMWILFLNHCPPFPYFPSDLGNSCSEEVKNAKQAWHLSGGHGTPTPALVRDGGGLPVLTQTLGIDREALGWSLVLLEGSQARAVLNTLRSWKPHSPVTMCPRIQPPFCGGWLCLHLGHPVVCGRGPWLPRSGDEEQQFGHRH